MLTDDASFKNELVLLKYCKACGSRIEFNPLPWADCLRPIWSKT